MKQFACTITFVIFITLSCVAGTNAEDKEPSRMEAEDWVKVVNVCNDSFRIEMAYIEALDTSGSFPDETDRTPKCFVRCLLETSGVASEDGIYDPKMAAKVFAGKRGGKVMNDLEDLAKSCAPRDEQCMCERAYQFTKCLMEKEIEEYEKPEE
ncbi:hypothetical protein O0L34_g15127 [Tuta absoluta]|nr:hypothetical protein O0L34_g15127 [Tuta absoluta]